jgi:hypothetical protein
MFTKKKIHNNNHIKDINVYPLILLPCSQYQRIEANNISFDFELCS